MYIGKYIQQKSVANSFKSLTKQLHEYKETIQFVYQSKI